MNDLYLINDTLTALANMLGKSLDDDTLNDLTLYVADIVRGSAA